MKYLVVFVLLSCTLEIAFGKSLVSKDSLEREKRAGEQGSWEETAINKFDLREAEELAETQAELAHRTKVLEGVNSTIQGIVGDVLKALFGGSSGGVKGSQETPKTKSENNKNV